MSHRAAFRCIVFSAALPALAHAADRGVAPSGDVTAVFEEHCFDCHDSVSEKAGLNLEALSLDASDPENIALWSKIHDRVKAGTMPPGKRAGPQETSRTVFLRDLSDAIVRADRDRIRTTGRSRVRRMNRFEYENALREALNAPWLQVADMLPEDGVVHLFNKSSKQLDVSHVQMAQYLKAADFALRTAVRAAAHPSTTHRYYAREEPTMQHYLQYRPNLQTSATRATIPLLVKHVPPSGEPYTGDPPPKKDAKLR
jgi:hypothetical protein